MIAWSFQQCQSIFRGLDVEVRLSFRSRIRVRVRCALLGVRRVASNSVLGAVVVTIEVNVNVVGEINWSINTQVLALLFAITASRSWSLWFCCHFN